MNTCKKLYRSLGVVPGQIAAAYRAHKSARKVSEIIGCSPRTVLRVARQFGVPIVPRGGASQKGKPKKIRHHGVVAEWLRKHPGKRLPTSITEIAALIGCSKDAVKCYFYRRRRTGERIPDLRSLRYRRKRHDTHHDG